MHTHQGDVELHRRRIAQIFFKRYPGPCSDKSCDALRISSISRPEQAEMSGLDIDTRSDIYSLDVLLYELLAGSTPFDAMRKTIREQEPPRLSTRLATLPANELTTTAKRRSADTSKLRHPL